MSAEVGARWTILGTVARFRAPPRGMLFGRLGDRPPVRAQPSEAARGAVEARLAPVLARLDRERRAWFDAVERDMRLKMAAAAAAGLVLGWLFMGGLAIGLALMVGAAFFAFLMLSAKTHETSRDATKHAIVDVMARELLGLSSVPPDARAAALPMSAVKGWRLLPAMRVLTIDDRLEGERDGARVAVSRVGFQPGGGANVTLRQGDGVAFVVVEISEPDAPVSAEPDPVTVVVGTDAPLLVRTAPRVFHGLSQAETGDADFDARYVVYGDPGPLEPAMRTRFRAFEAVARCDATGTREVPAGAGLRPAVVLRPGRWIALTPIPVFDGALEPPPFWEPLRAESLIPAFASDLAILDEHLAAALALRGADPRTGSTA